MASRIIAILLFNLAFSALTLTAPLHRQAMNIDRSRRQTLGTPAVAKIMTVSEDTASGTETCPTYGDENCGNIQDMLCTAQAFQDEYDERVSDNQASVESVDSCAQAFPSSANNLRSLYDDYRTLASIFMQVGQDFAFPNFAEVQCQVQRVDSYLEETVEHFCEFTNEECARVRYNCDTDFTLNPVFNYSTEQFSANCFNNLLNSMQMVLRILHHSYFLGSSTTSGERVCAPHLPALQCFRASNNQTNSLESFRTTLRERQQSLPSSLLTYNQTECKPAEVLDMSVLGVYSTLVETAHELSTVPSQSDLVEQLNTTILPLIRQLVTHIVLDEETLNELIITLPSNSLELSEDVAMTSCLVTRLTVTFETLLHDQLRHKWTVVNRPRDTGCI